jgi:hypothetical protein
MDQPKIQKGDHVKTQQQKKKWWERQTKRQEQQERAREILANLTENRPQSEELPRRPRRFSVKEVAEYFGVNPFTIYHWKDPRIGLIEASYDGKYIYFTKEQVLACEAARAAGISRRGAV